MKELWAYGGDRISVRFEYEWRDSAGQWYRTHGNEHWEFDEEGLMCRRDMSANDVPIRAAERRISPPSAPWTASPPVTARSNQIARAP